MAEKHKTNADMWVIKIPILSVSCPYSGSLMSMSVLEIASFSREMMKDKCHHLANPNWLMWVYPKCEKESCPLKENK